MLSDVEIFIQLSYLNEYLEEVKETKCFPCFIFMPQFT